MVPVLDYCDTVYVTSNITQLDKLRKLQIIACRMILMLTHDAIIYTMHSSLEHAIRALRKMSYAHMLQADKGGGTPEVVVIMKPTISHSRSTTRSVNVVFVNPSLSFAIIALSVGMEPKQSRV